MEKLTELLEKTSRTFALAIPLLPEPTRHEVTIAYLLFRIADTFEDGEQWSAPRRMAALEQLALLLQDPQQRRCVELGRQWSHDAPTANDAYRELLAETETVFGAYRALPPMPRSFLCTHVQRTARGMRDIVRSTGARGQLRLRTLADLRHYCYLVAGIVGEMLTELFLHGRPKLQPVAEYLRSRSQAFGEGLQLVNILKDAEEDAKDGRIYLPDGVTRAEVGALADRDLDRATEYSAALQEMGADRGIIAFTALPVMLGRAALRRIREAGSGAKVPRNEVMAIYQGLQNSLDAGRPVFALLPSEEPQLHSV